MREETIWISHRGYKKDFLENTREAFQAAVDNGFHYIETDLRTTSDGHIVLSHDANLTRAANISIDVEKLTREELEKVELPGGQRLYFLDQLLNEFKDIHWTFDIKLSERARTTEIFIELIQKMGLKDWVDKNVYFISWSLRKEKQLCKYFPRVPHYIREENCWRAGLSSFLQLPFLGNIKPHRTYALVPKFIGFSTFTSRIVGNYHSRKARVIAFLPLTQEDSEKALKAGFDEILTDHLPSN